MLVDTEFEFGDPLVDSEGPVVGYSEIRIIGRDLVNFNVTRFGTFITKIDLSFNYLKRIDGLNTCSESLEELILDNNQLEQIELGTTFPKLHTVSLNKNRIWHICSIIRQLKSNAMNVRFLSLLGNPICPDQLTSDNIDESDYPKYRYHILHHLKTLKFLDHRQVKLDELIESRKLIYSTISNYTPLPSSTRITRTLAYAAGVTNGKHSSNIVETSPSVSFSDAPSAVQLPPPPVNIVVSDTTVRKPQVYIPITSNVGVGQVTLVQPRSKQGKRSMKYVGKNSEGNRFIKDTDL